jgi:hypothetical protein
MTEMGAPSHRGWPGYLAMSRAGATTMSVVTAVDRGNHCGITYSFNIGLRSYSGRGSNCALNVGEAARVSYLPSDPSFNCLGSADKRFFDELLAAILVSLAVPSVVLFSLWRKFVLRGQ